MRILFTGYLDPRKVSLTEGVYMSLLKEGQNRGNYPNLEFIHFNVEELAKTGNLDLLEEACKTADFIYHYGIVFERMMIEARASKKLIKDAHVLIFDQFRGKSVCRNEKVCEEKNPDRKDFQYQAIREAQATDQVPLIPSYTFLEMKEKFDRNVEIALPLVFKDPRVDNGWGCFLIENREQLEIIFDDSLYIQAEQSQIIPVNDLLSVRDVCFFQEFIESEPNHPSEESHARILIHTTAKKILGFVLFQAEKPMDKIEPPQFDSKGFVSLYSNPHSPLYLNARKAKPTESNTVPIYSCDMLNSKPLSEKDIKILNRHNLQEGEIPEELSILAQTCADVMSKNGMGGVIGIDLIHDPKTNTWYFLECNFPASGAFEQLYGYLKGRRTNIRPTILRVQQVLKAWQEYALTQS